MSKYESEDKMINPSHYKSENGIECIDAIKAAVEDKNGVEGYLAGNAIKYLWRYNKKGKAVQDIEKALWYITELLNEKKNSTKYELKVNEELKEIYGLKEDFILVSNNKTDNSSETSGFEDIIKTLKDLENRLNCLEYRMNTPIWTDTIPFTVRAFSNEELKTTTIANEDHLNV